MKNSGLIPRPHRRAWYARTTADFFVCDGRGNLVAIEVKNRPLTFEGLLQFRNSNAHLKRLLVVLPTDAKKRTAESVTDYARHLNIEVFDVAELPEVIASLKDSG